MDSSHLLRTVLRIVLGDLSRSLRSWKHRYAKSFYRFGGDEVICMVQRCPGKSNNFEFVAGCYSNDPLLVGVASHGVYWFLRDGPYKSKEEASASLLNSVTRAAKLHGDTQFMLSATFWLNEFRVYRNGAWQTYAGSPAFRRCHGCSRPVPDGAIVCSICGEPVGS